MAASLHSPPLLPAHRKCASKSAGKWRRHGRPFYLSVAARALARRHAAAEAHAAWPEHQSSGQDSENADITFRPFGDWSNDRCHAVRASTVLRQQRSTTHHQCLLISMRSAHGGMAAGNGNPHCSYISNFEVFSTGKEAILEEIVMPLLLTVLF